MLPDDGPTPAKIIGELLKTHPEAGSLLAEASHCQALVAWSTADSGIKLQVAQAARLAYEELRHRLEPRGGRPVHFDVGLLFLAALGVGLVMLNLIELSGVLDRSGLVLLALAATAVWVTIAWLAAVAGRRRRWGLVAAVVGAAIVLGLLLVAVHGLAPPPGWPTVGGRSRGSRFFGALAGAFIVVLVAGAAGLIARMEPVRLFVARRLWHRARSDHKAAVQTRQADLEAAAIASESWFGLVRTWVTTIARGEDRLIAETMAFAVALLESGRPKLPPAE